MLGIGQHRTVAQRRLKMAASIWALLQAASNKAECPALRYAPHATHTPYAKQRLRPRITYRIHVTQGTRPTQCTQRTHITQGFKQQTTQCTQLAKARTSCTQQEQCTRSKDSDAIRATHTRHAKYAMHTARAQYKVWVSVQPNARNSRNVSQHTQCTRRALGTGCKQRTQSYVSALTLRKARNAHTACKTTFKTAYYVWYARRARYATHAMHASHDTQGFKQPARQPRPLILTP